MYHFYQLATSVQRNLLLTENELATGARYLLMLCAMYCYAHAFKRFIPDKRSVMTKEEKSDATWRRVNEEGISESMAISGGRPENSETDVLVTEDEYAYKHLVTLVGP